MPSGHRVIVPYVACRYIGQEGQSLVGFLLYTATPHQQGAELSILDGVFYQSRDEGGEWVARAHRPHHHQQAQIVERNQDRDAAADQLWVRLHPDEDHAAALNRAIGTHPAVGCV